MIRYAHTHSPDTIQSVLDNLEPWSLREARAAGGPGWQAIMRAGVKKDGCAVALNEAGALAIFGCSPVAPGIGCPWMLLTPAGLSYPREIVRMGKNAVKDWGMNGYPVLLNYVHDENLTAQRWLWRIGFTVSTHAISYGPRNEPFRLFTYTHVLLHPSARRGR